MISTSNKSASFTKAVSGSINISPADAARAVPQKYRKPLWFVVVSIVASNAVLFSVLVLASQGSKSPFSAYEALFSTDPLRAASALGFACTVDQDSSSPTLGHCALQPTNGRVRNISVRVSSVDAHEMIFRFNDSALTLGDLILLWGMPIIRTCDGSMMISWPEHRIAALAAVPDTLKFNYFLAIQYVVFSSEQVPGWERLWMNDFRTGGCNDQRVYSTVPGIIALPLSTMR
jgi:hypothetical protein